MIRVIFKIFKWFFVAVFALFVLGVILATIDPPPKQPRQDPAVSKKESEDGLLIMQKAHVLGRSMARGGAIKPSSEQIDALSRRAQTAAGDTHTRTWFKQYFEFGFWDGWKSR